MKRTNPYNYLKAQFVEFVNSVTYRRRVRMWTYPKAKLSQGWSLVDLNERVASADQLGFDVQLRSTDDGLVVEYIAKIPTRPFNL